MNIYLLQSIALLSVFAFGYLIVEKAIPKTERAFTVTIALFISSGLVVFLLFSDSPILKAVAWGLAWLGVISINKRRKLTGDTKSHPKP